MKRMRRAIEFIFALLNLILIGSAAGQPATTQPASQPSESAVAMQMKSSGEVSLLIQGSVLASGKWGLQFSPAEKFDADEEALGPVLKSVGEQQSPLHATVRDEYAAATADYEYQLNDEDLRISVHLQNTDAARTLKKVKFSGITFHFAKPPEGELPSWHISYLDAHGRDGRDLYHPSTMAPIGAAYAADGHFGFSAYTESEFLKRSLFQAAWVAEKTIPAECQLQFYTDESVAPGQAVDVDFSLRLSRDVSMRHLLEPYKKAFDARFPAMQYHPDHRPMVRFTSADRTHASPENPLGYNGQAHRLDTAIGTRQFLNFVVPRLRRADAIGCIFWTLAGFNPRGAMYRPDFDEFPPAVAANVPTIVKTFKAAGLRVGLCARPADGVKPLNETQDGTYPLSPDDPAQMAMILGRFRNAMAMGFDVFYCDSFGEGLRDVRILKILRDAIGPDVLLYTELGSDVMLPLAGRYCEWNEGGLAGLSNRQYEILRYLCPDSTWLCFNRTHNPLPKLDDGRPLTMLVEDHAVSMLPVAPPH